MEKNEPPNYNINIQITPPEEDELDWTSTIMYMINKSEDNSVEAPMQQYPELEPRMKYVVGSFIHEN